MIELSIDNDVAVVTLNNPGALNAVNEQALADLAGALDEAAAQGVRALVLRGEGRAFCAGRDIAGVDPATDDALGFLSEKVTPVLKKIAEFPAPTFAVVQGACLGVGLGLANSADVVYVAENAKIGSPFANLGATLDSGGHALFFERLGAHRAMDLIVTGELISGSQAVSEGLFSRAIPAEELDEFTRAQAAKAARGATLAFLASKRLIASLRDERPGLWESIDQENREQGGLCTSADYAEGFAAFQEKRRPAFTGTNQAQEN